MSSEPAQSDGKRTFLSNSLRSLVILTLIITTVVTLGFVAITPSTDVPVGVVQASGMSMTPTYSGGDWGLAVYGPGELQQGDVVIFYDRRSTEEFVMHRAVRKTEKGFITKGDALTRTDQAMGRSYVTPETRVGEVYLVVDGKGLHLPAI